MNIQNPFAVARNAGGVKNNKMAKQIYLDNAATTKVDEKVVKEMLPYFSENFGNASSQHDIGIRAKEALEKSRRTIGLAIKGNPGELIFTSGGTESNNLALKGLFFANYPNKNHIITTGKPGNHSIPSPQTSYTEE